MSFMQTSRTFGRAAPYRQSHDFALLCRRYNDAFSAVETLLAKLCKKLAIKNTENVTAGQRIAQLKLVKANPQLSKANAVRIRQICDEFSRQIPVRNAMAHGAMILGTKANEEVAFFQKADDAAIGNPVYVVMSNDEFMAAIQSIGEIASQLQTLITPASSSLQPKQAAANGP